MMLFIKKMLLSLVLFFIQFLYLIIGTNKWMNMNILGEKNNNPSVAEFLNKSESPKVMVQCGFQQLNIKCTAACEGNLFDFSCLPNRVPPLAGKFKHTKQLEAAFHLCRNNQFGRGRNFKGCSDRRPGRACEVKANKHRHPNLAPNKMRLSKCIEDESKISRACTTLMLVPPK